MKQNFIVRDGQGELSSIGDMIPTDRDLNIIYIEGAMEYVKSLSDLAELVKIHNVDPENISNTAVSKIGKAICRNEKFGDFLVSVVDKFNTHPEVKMCVRLDIPDLGYVINHGCTKAIRDIKTIFDHYTLASEYHYACEELNQCPETDSRNPELTRKVLELYQAYMKSTDTLKHPFANDPRPWIASARRLG